MSGAPDRTIPELVDEYFAQYQGRDSTRTQRLGWWVTRLGTRAAAEIADADVCTALEALAATPARVYAGKDADGVKVFRGRGENYVGKDHAGKPIFTAPAKRSPSTVNRYQVALGALYSWAIKTRRLPKGFVSPCKDIGRRQEPKGIVRFLTEAERAQLLAACKRSKWKRLYALVLLAVTTGARRGELLALTWREVDLAGARAYVTASKNGDRRVLPLTPAAVAELERFRTKKDLDACVFRSRLRPLKPFALETVWRAAIERSGVENFRFHDLRHTAASYLAQSGASILEIADVLGHRDLKMAQRYSHLTTTSKAALVNRVLGDIR